MYYCWPLLTNPIISLAPGGLSTWRPFSQNEGNDGFAAGGIWNFAAGGIWNDPKAGNLQESIDFGAGIAPIDVKDLACPTWGLGHSTSDDGTVITTIGPPYLPIVIPPMSVFSLDPIWALACTLMYTNIAGETTLVVVDVPIALTPTAKLLPNSIVPPALAKPTTIAELALSSTMPANLASVAKDPVAPVRTQDHGKDRPTPPPVIVLASPTSLPDDSAGSSDGKDDPPSDPLSTFRPSASVVAGDSPSDRPSDFEAGVGDPLAGSIAPLSSANDSPLDDS